MTQLLVSVRNASEAVVASQSPAAIVDVKEPGRGALGEPDPLTLQQITEVVPLEQTLSFAAGELGQWLDATGNSSDDPIGQRYRQSLHRFQYVKIGLAGMVDRRDWKIQWQSLLQNLPNEISPVVVSYLDHRTCSAPSPTTLVAFASRQKRCCTILFDTFEKRGNLFAHLSPTKLERLVSSSHQAGLQVVVAGSIDLLCLPQVVAVNPDFVGVRGAACRGDRTGPIDGRLVSELAMTLQAPTPD